MDDPNANPNTNTPPASAAGNETAPAWHAAEGIDQSLVTDKVKGFSDMNALLKSYMESQSFIGKGIPDENTPEDVAKAFWEKMGVPESADKYSWSPPEGVSVDGVTSEEFKAFKGIAHKARLTNTQMNDIMGGWSDIVKGLQEKATTFLAEQSAGTKAALAKDWGDKADEKLGATIRKIEELGIKPHLEASGLLMDYNVLKAFHSILSSKQETRIAGADGQQVSIAERVEQIRKDPIYLNRNHPEHANMVGEHNRLVEELAAAKR